ncbi:copper-translocating P-type ATPase [Thermaurantimonas aggregans]|uniref:Copper-translocating P-type ATPase n=2 Tax=Thermaurantimonas aggregans TaxID=2173829 RepID=A0A401XJD1_9FLAO|nr:copper-translocating P-type ATPase [Thermaurantimonas aggregans]
MSCAACAATVEKELRNQPGVKSATVSYASGCAVVEFDEEKTNPDQLRIAVRALGYDMDTGEYNRRKHREAELKAYKNLRQRTFASLILAAPVMVIAMIWMHDTWANYVLWPLTTGVIWFGRRIFTNAWKMTLSRQSGMDTLVAISTGTAYVLSTLVTFFPSHFAEFLGHHTYYEPAAMVIAFVLLGKYLEERSRLRATDFLDTLTSNLPETALRLTGETWEEIPVHLVQPGDVLMARMGDRIAVDGQVTDGQAWIDESILTGESLPVSKKTGDLVFAGTINTDGILQYRATQTGSESRFAKIIALVEAARSSKPSVQRLADRISAIFVPIVLSITLLTFLGWWFFGGSDAFSIALTTSLAVLVVACPCALGLATPTAIVNAIGTTAKWGILVKNAETFEIASRVSHIFLDKTGTLTSGTPAIDTIYYHTDAPKDFIHSLLLSMESRSNHPLAKAIVQHLSNKVQLLNFDEWTYHPGRGIESVYNGQRYYLGSEQWMKEILNTSSSNTDALAGTHFYLFTSSERLATISFHDTLRPQAVEAIKELNELKINVAILSGDADKAVESIARDAGISEFHSQCSPEQKLEVIHQKKAEGHIVAMAGDGINDGAALAAADLGIAMGSGAHLAIESAQIVIKNDSPLLIARMLRFARRVRSIIYQNLFWAFIYNIIAIPIAAGIFYPTYGILLQPHWAGAAMAFSSVSVVMSSLRLRYHKHM